MVNRALVPVLGLFALSMFPCAAATVCVLVVESGIAQDAARVEASSAWEGALMDSFFDAGHIVCNADTARLDGPGLPPASYGLKDALEGGADYLVLIALEYPLPAGEGGNKAAAARIAPKSVRYRLATSKGIVLSEGKPSALSASANAEEDTANARGIANALISRMKER